MKDKLFKILVLGCLGVIAADAALDLRAALAEMDDEDNECHRVCCGEAGCACDNDAEAGEPDNESGSGE